MKSDEETSPEFDRFNALLGKVLSVPKAVLNQRLEEHEKQSKLNPKRRGPKPKAEHDEGHS
jgi:hypothetical protein